MKKLLALVLVFMFAAAVLLSGCADKEEPVNEAKSSNEAVDTVQQTEADEEQNTDEPAEPVADEPAYKEAYTALVENGIIEEDIEFLYGLLNIDGDDIPELVAYSNDMGLGYLFTYKNDAVCTVLEAFGFGVGGNAGYEYIEGENVIKNRNADFAGLRVYENFWRINDKGELETINEYELYTDYYIDANGNDFPDEDEITEQPHYYYNDEEITEEEYNEYAVDGAYSFITNGANCEMTKEQVLEALK